MARDSRRVAIVGVTEVDITSVGCLVGKKNGFDVLRGSVQDRIVTIRTVGIAWEDFTLQHEGLADSTGSRSGDGGVVSLKCRLHYNSTRDKLHAVLNESQVGRDLGCFERCGQGKSGRANLEDEVVDQAGELFSDGDAHLDRVGEGAASNAGKRETTRRPWASAEDEDRIEVRSESGAAKIECC
ncbi:hypothetical protein KCU59_g60, partial [Aureobasidium melanogenum]